jgi:serine/threonine-protein kinase
VSDSETRHHKVQVCFLGSLTISDGGRDLTSVLAQPKRLALLALLALSRPYGLHRRDTICAQLWPESPDDKARAALRQLLLVLRRDLGEDAFVTRGDLVGLNRDRVATDAGAVFDALEAGDDAAAVDRYTGELLAGLHLSEGEVFEPWVDSRRRDLHQGVTRAAWRLVDRKEAGGDLAAARRAAERAMMIDPENEQGLRRLLTLLARSGDRAAALRAADDFARRLRQDWATEPEQATIELIERIRAGQLAAVRPQGNVTELMAAAAPTLRESVPPNDRFDEANGLGEALARPVSTTIAVGPSTSASSVRSSRLSLVTAAALVLLASGFALWGWLRAVPQPVSRYELAIPVNRAMRNYNRPQFALAPDGSWLVYTGPGSVPGVPQLWVRRRDRLEATPLSATAGALTPSVSPDGQWIAFTADGQLRKVPAGGGSATTIADTAFAGRSSVWLDDGTVAYSDDQHRLRRVPASGGVSEVVFTPRAGQIVFGPMAGLPNGRGVLFLTCDRPCAVFDLWVADGQSANAKLLLPDVTWAAYHDGRLLFARRDGAVFAMPFDLGKLNMEGDPVPLIDGVRVLGTAHISLAASGTLAYLAAAGESGSSEAVWVSRDGRAVPVDPAWEFRLSQGGPAWGLSPDGTRLAISLNAAGNNDIWIKDLDRGPLSRLTFSEGYDFRPRWAPDGRSVAFLSNRADGPGLYQTRADGTGADSLVLQLDKISILEALWSRDRRWLVIRTGGAVNGSLNGGRDIHALEVGRDTAPRPLLTAPYDESAPALSPDGRWLAYVSTETGRGEVFVRPFPEVETGKWQISRDGGSSPVWAHSGRELFFISSGRELMSQSVGPGAAFQRGEQRVLFPLYGMFFMDGHYPALDVSPDDQRFLMVRPKSAAEAQVLTMVENWLEEVKQAMKGR